MISRTTKSFWKHFDRLPQDIQTQATRAYRLWRSNPCHPSLQFKCISDKHQAYSIRIVIHWRALAYREEAAERDIVTWFWIGSHADYDALIK